MNLEELVSEFASHVAAQTEAVARGMPGTANRHARRYGAAFEKLRAHGEAGMNALAVLLSHSRWDVRTTAATYLREHGHPGTQAQAVLAAKSDPGPPRRPRLVQTRPHPRQPPELPPSLAPHRGLLERAMAPCILFDKREGSPHARGSRYGGLPLVPEGTQWPRSPEGPLHFLGQLDFAELTACRGDALPELPKEGLLAFFYDVENQPWGHKASDRAFWHLVYIPPDVEPVPLPPPAELMEAERPVLPPCQLIPSLGLSLPDWWDIHAPVEPGFWNDAQAEDYIELRRKLGGAESVDQAVDQVRGHPAWVQEDARVQAQLISKGVEPADSQAPSELDRLKQEAAQWNLLWQVGSDEALGLVWGSYGTLFLLIRDEDLRACRFERSWLILQCT